MLSKKERLHPIESLFKSSDQFGELEQELRIMAQTMQAWQYSSTTPSLEANLRINTTAPKPSISATEILVQVHFAALNPVDHKVTESPLPLRLVGSNLIPCADFSGVISAIGSTITDLSVGDRVFGVKLASFANGSLAQYISVSRTQLARLPDGVDLQDAAGVSLVGLTEYQAIAPNVQAGDKVFVNGGSGGTGAYGVQIAKALGCHVTATCSTGNVELVKELGADEVLDYKSVDIVEVLKGKGQVFKLVVDNIGSPPGLYKASDAFLIKGGKFVQIGATLSFGGIKQVTSNMMLPKLLGGGKSSFQLLTARPDQKQLEQFAQWLKEGKLKAVTDNLFEWQDAPKAFERLKTGRARGKVLVRVEQTKE